MKFKRKDIIKTDDKFYECICADSQMAVFGKIKEWTQGCIKTSYTNIFAISQKVQDGFKFELVAHHKIRVIPDSDGGL